MTRRDEILKLIVEYFIRYAEPIGSKTLMTKYKLDISSATIRNEMNALEKMGFIEKPHTSGGRVPTEKGYQYYVDNLRTGGVEQQAKNALQNILSEKTKSVEEVMKESCEILSQMTNLASVVIGQSVDDERLVSVQVIPLSNNTATAVFVTDKGYVENKTFLMEEGTRVDQVVKTVKLLNDRLTGTPLSQVVSKMEALRPALTDYMVGQELIYEAIMGVFAKLATERMELYGQEELYKQPEFANDAGKLRELLSFIDDPEEFKRILKSGKTSGNVTISIGNKEYGYENLALVSTNINVPGEKGTLSVLGPARMDYDKVVATLQYFAEALDNYFSATTKGGQECSTKEKKKNAKSPNSPKKKAKK